MRDNKYNDAHVCRYNELQFSTGLFGFTLSLLLSSNLRSFPTNAGEEDRQNVWGRLASGKLASARCYQAL